MTASQPTRMCKTRYLGPTDHRGSRVKAIHLCTLRAVIMPWRCELDAIDNHELAAREALRTGPDEQLRYCSDPLGEMYWVVVP